MVFDILNFSMNMESINFVPPTPEYVEDEKLTLVRESADFDLYDDETLNKAESQNPDFIKKRSKKLAELPVLVDDDFVPSAINRFASSNLDNIKKAEDIFDREMDQSIVGVEGQVETPPEVALYIRDLLNILPRILRAEGAEKMTRFNPGRIVFIDPEATDREYAKTLKENRAVPGNISGGAYFKQFDQVIVIDAAVLDYKASLSFLLMHELIHALGFNSLSITNIDDKSKRINLNDRRSGVKSLGKDKEILLALNETVTEGFATKVAIEYGDIFPYVVDALSGDMDELLADDSIRNKVNEPVAVEILPFKFRSGFLKNWKTTRDVSSSTYKIYTLKYNAYFKEIANRNNVPFKNFKDDVMPKLKKAYLTGKMLPFFRTLFAYGVSVEDLKLKDESIREETKREEEKKINT